MKTKIKTWKTIEVGGTSAEELIKQIEAKDIYVSDWAKAIMRQPAFIVGKKRKVNLARMTVRELGFTEYPTTTELLKRVKELGSLCDAKVGPHLRLAFGDQSKGDWCYMAMNPIPDSGDNPSVFEVGRYDNGELWFDGHCAYPDDRWSLDRGVVFVLGKSSKLEPLELPTLDTLDFDTLQEFKIKFNGQTYRITKES